MLWLIQGPSLAVAPVYLAGNEEQKKKYLGMRIWAILKKALFLNNFRFLSYKFPSLYISFRTSCKRARDRIVLCDRAPGRVWCEWSQDEGESTLWNCNQERWVQAVKKGDEWVINGTKMWITGGGHAKWSVILPLFSKILQDQQIFYFFNLFSTFLCLWRTSWNYPS